MVHRTGLSETVQASATGGPTEAASRRDGPRKTMVHRTELSQTVQSSATGGQAEACTITAKDLNLCWARRFATAEKKAEADRLKSVTHEKHRQKPVQVKMRIFAARHNLPGERAGCEAAGPIDNRPAG